EDGAWVSEGWWGVEPFDCREVISEDLTRAFYYWRATNVHGAFRDDAFSFCTEGSAFTIVGDHDCEGRGYRKEQFREEKLNGATDYYITLTAEDAPSGTVQIQDSAAPGTYGEPYSVQGRLEGCFYEADDLYCEVTADGWFYIAPSYHPTGSWVFEGLEALEPGSEVVIHGDMVSVDGVNAEVTIREYDIIRVPVAPPADDLAWLMTHLQGIWTSNEDSGYSMIIGGTQLDEIYDSNLIQRSFFELHPSCAASNGAGPVIIAYPEPDEGQGPSCFLVTETGRNSLGLIDLLNNTLSFHYAQ
ncbi:MAG: DUF1036 domain-containing protein, partial [Rhodobacteraceae bacterium]|nr:DUF1036 domain-containing protein [Paracoccaceae bacterium]